MGLSMSENHCTLPLIGSSCSGCVSSATFASFLLDAHSVMAQIVKRALSDGRTVRYDVRPRVDGTVRNKTFRLRKDANAYKRKAEGDELAGLVADPPGW